MQSDIENLSTAARRAIDPTAPLPLRTMAAKGVLPGAKPAEIVIVLTLIARGGEHDLAQIARETLQKLPAPILEGTLAANLPSEAIEELVPNYGSVPDIVLSLLRMPRISADALCALAQGASQQIAEIIATNETLLLKFPLAIEKLYMNKHTRMSTADRLIDLAVRNHIELSIPAFKLAAEAILGQNIAAPTVKGGQADVDASFEEVARLAAELSASLAADEDTHALNDKGEEKVIEKMVPLYAQIANMSITQKIRRATLGTSAERLLLVRDSNRLVATAAASSPLLNESEAARIASSRTVSEDVLRIICRNPEFTRSYQVKLNLVLNPRTPFTFASRMMPLLRDNDIRLIAKNKNVPGAIQKTALQQISRKTK